MLGEDGPAPLHQGAQQFGARSLRQMIGDGAIGYVVRRLRLRRRAEGGWHVAAVDEDVAVADAGMELKPAAGDRAAESRVDCLDQRAAVLAGDVAGREVAHLPVLDRHEIAADGPVVGAEGNAHRGRFERRAAGVDLRADRSRTGSAWPRRWPESATAARCWTGRRRRCGRCGPCSACGRPATASCRPESLAARRHSRRE